MRAFLIKSMRILTMLAGSDRFACGLWYSMVLFAVVVRITQAVHDLLPACDAYRADAPHRCMERRRGLQALQPHDPKAPHDAYGESDGTGGKALNMRLKRQNRSEGNK